MKTSVIDLSSLPAPTVLEPLDPETIFQEMLADLQERDETFTALVESDPAYKQMEVFAYREMLIRQRVNDGAKSVLLAYTSGPDLDGLAATFDIERHVITEATDNEPAVMESDKALLRRVQLAMDGLGSAGSTEGYLFHSLSADPMVRDANPTSPSPMVVDVYIWSHEDGGIPSAEVLAAVDEILSAESVRPLTDQVTVKACTIENITVTAEIETYAGVGQEEVRLAAESALIQLMEGSAMLGMHIPQSAIYAALHVPDGVKSAKILSPAGDISLDASQAPGDITAEVNLKV